MNDPDTSFAIDQVFGAQRLSVRPVRDSDLDLIVRHRRKMFADNGHGTDVLIEMTSAFQTWLGPRLASGAYFGWIVETEDGEPVAGLGMMVIDWPPHPRHPRQDCRGFITNVFVEPQRRGAGLARALMTIAVGEGRRRGVDLMVLHASPMGRPLYERMGWVDSSEMMLALR